ncbi:hypothetical protein GN244_ATG18623 [Phytophthora infestans]|uniref:Uncharacterized protein n=1 Tax=Phytophthora infestans TaxID=4787 RepID=A0A833WJY2_PHYIN|nr:hypothetical protein GN244_ATG18623 [Phytophthora infestans]KAF4135361.1 hypothetical protein GN958_ATG15426 [Phytophthora infestans]
MRVENEDELQLIVADEQLSSLEDVVRTMPRAQYLNVTFNCISSLRYLEKMKELRSLDISHNAVESLQEVATLSNLLVLKCSSNQIADLSWIAGLNQLEELWIRDNRVESAQVAHLQQLSALQTLVIHPNPCTERGDYVLAIVKVLPWLQRVDTVAITEELREEARHAEERGDLDSGATDCPLFSLSGRSEDPRSNETSVNDRVATPPAPPDQPSKPTTLKKQMTAEEFMRAFPVQDFIPVDCNGISTAQPGSRSMVSVNEVLQPQTANSVASTHAEDNQKETVTAEQVFVSIGNSLLSDNGLPKVGMSDKSVAILDSVLTLPTFGNNSFFKKKKSQSQLSVKNKSRQRGKAKSASISQNESHKPFHQDQEYTVAYPNSTVSAIQVRRDGSAIARWASGSVAVSVDYETSPDRSGYRVYAAHKDGQLALSFDPAGVGFLNAYPSGKTLLSTTSDGNGLLFDIGTGAIVRQWDTKGNLRDGTCQPADALGSEPDGSLLCRLSEQLAVRVQLTHTRTAQQESTNDIKRETTSPIALRINFAGATGIRHVFLNSANRAEPCNADACDYALGKASSKEDMAKAAKQKPPPMEHTDLLSSIRAAVAGL